MLPSSEILTTQTAILQHEAGSLKITTGLPIPELEPHDILVRTASVALNPCDFKMPLRFPTPGLWDGCDFAGTIVGRGGKAAADGRFHIGDKVFGAVQGSNQSDPSPGSYCEYLKIDQDFAFHVPKGVSFSTAPAVSGTGIATLGVALFWSLQIPGSLEAPSKSPVDILVYGGSSSIGLLAIQIVKLCGHRVITTCSPKNFDLVRSYGADLVFDYNSNTCAQDIRSATKNTLRYALDPFAETNTIRLCQDAIGRTGGRYCALEQYQEHLCTRKTINNDLVMGGAISGNGVMLPEPYGIPPQPEIGTWARQWYRTIQRLVDAGKIRPSPVKLLPGRFEGIIEGLKMLKEGTVSGQKLVVLLETAV